MPASPAEARSFVLNDVTRGGRERRYTIGACSDWSTADARREAKRLRHLIDQGADPLADVEAERSADRRRAVRPVRARAPPRKRESTAGDYGRMLANDIRPALGHLKVSEVTFTDIDALHRKLSKAGHPYAANRCVALLSKMFSLSARWRMRETNPCKGIEKNLEHHRRRYLSGDELVRLVRRSASIRTSRLPMSFAFFCLPVQGGAKLCQLAGLTSTWARAFGANQRRAPNSGRTTRSPAVGASPAIAERDLRRAERQAPRARHVRFPRRWRLGPPR